MAQHKRVNSTYCNPINIEYRYRKDTPSSREAADPVIVLFKDTYFLFASKSGGYWSSPDLKQWHFITNTVLPWEDYAPTVVVISNELFFLASGKKVFKTSDPLKGNWEQCGEIDSSVIDPCLFLDEDNRLYLYYGCSNKTPTKVVELDKNNHFKFIGNPIEIISSNTSQHGFEQKGDSNTGKANPWIEGSWMTKYHNKYYLQYAGPGTEYMSYGDGVYVSDSPTTHFEYQTHNPISLKPSGFINGAGHSGTFKDKFGNYWRIATMTISVKQMFERRLGLFPMAFDKDGLLYTYTGFGDYPFLFPTKKVSNPEKFFSKWMLLSYHKPLTVSSTLDTVKYASSHLVDENIRTWWSAKTGDSKEWVVIDLEKNCNVHSIQINFADVATTTQGIPTIQKGYQYILETSLDSQHWYTVEDASKNLNNLPHPYVELEKPIIARYVRLTNISTPSGNFAISDLRVFGLGNGIQPKSVSSFDIIRDSADKRIVHLAWSKQPNVVGYNIRYGISKDKLYLNHIVYNKEKLNIRSLNKVSHYWFSIDAFNENGITQQGIIRYVE